MMSQTLCMTRTLHDWDKIQEYHDAGHGFVECSNLFGFTHTAWIKAIQRNRLRVPRSMFPDRRRKYNWPEIQEYYDAGYSYKQCKKRFRFCAGSWTGAVRRGKITPRKFGMPISELLSNPQRNRKHIKVRLITAGLLENRCSACGVTVWQGKALNMHLRMLCPNCHSQTTTYDGRNARRNRCKNGGAPVV